MTVNQKTAQAAACLCPSVYRLAAPHFSELENKLQEIRLRVACPAALLCVHDTYYLTESGGLTDLPCGDLYRVTRGDLDSTFQRICDYSVYARQRELLGGFITLRGGHRVGVCGTAVTQNGTIINVRGISSLNIRIAREHRGCGEGVLRRIGNKGGVLLCGAPCSGKTTLLRDLARLLSERGQTVSLIDERGELAAVYDGEPQNDVGLCDVFNGYPRAQAIEQALRCMSPQVIICDEIGSEEDALALRQCLHSGVRVIAAAHAADREELYARPALREILATGAFSTLIFLRGRDHAGEIASWSREGERRAA